MTDEETSKEYLGEQPRAQGVNVKARTKFGAVHFSIRHDEQNRVTGIAWDTAASEIHKKSDIAGVLDIFTDALNEAITAMNQDWSSKWNLKAVAERQA